MSKPYSTDAELPHTGISKTIWTLQEIEKIYQAFDRKGYLVQCFSREDHTGVRHDALIVQRKDYGVISEYLFTQRIRFESNAEGRGEVAIILVENTSEKELTHGIRKHLPRNIVLEDSL